MGGCRQRPPSPRRQSCTDRDASRVVLRRHSTAGLWVWYRPHGYPARSVIFSPTHIHPSRAPDQLTPKHSRTSCDARPENAQIKKQQQRPAEGMCTEVVRARTNSRQKSTSTLSSRGSGIVDGHLPRNSSTYERAARCTGDGLARPRLLLNCPPTVRHVWHSRDRVTAGQRHRPSQMAKLDLQGC